MDISYSTACISVSGGLLITLNLSMFVWQRLTVILCSTIIGTLLIVWRKCSVSVLFWGLLETGSKPQYTKG